MQRSYSRNEWSKFWTKLCLLIYEMTLWEWHPCATMYVTHLCGTCLLNTCAKYTPCMLTGQHQNSTYARECVSAPAYQLRIKKEKNVPWYRVVMERDRLSCILIRMVDCANFWLHTTKLSQYNIKNYYRPLLPLNSLGHLMKK